jgi:thioredoxin-like negative regulator of GroEL
MNEWSRTELTSFIDHHSTGMVYFYTPLCGTCQVASRMLEITEQVIEIPSGKMNLNFHPDLAKNFAIESVPCLLFIKNGLIVETIYAFHSVPYLLEKIKQYLT